MALGFAARGGKRLAPLARSPSQALLRGTPNRRVSHRTPAGRASAASSASRQLEAAERRDGRRLELKDFILSSAAADGAVGAESSSTAGDDLESSAMNIPASAPFAGDTSLSFEGLESAQSLHQTDHHPGSLRTRNTYYIETYGCQMNVADTEIVHAVLAKAGFSIVNSADEAGVILINTCAIRENAEDKVWLRLNAFRAMKRKIKKSERPVVGVLGCMAERLKQKLLESDKQVDLVAGPDAYRDLPNLIGIVRDGEQAANVQLSQDETYADIAPVRTSSNSVSAFVSCMRGCNNMCAYCIVPFTRGRERSRPFQSLLDEVKDLADAGYKDVVLLGQNVNSYHHKVRDPMPDAEDALPGTAEYKSSRGFKNIFRLRDGHGYRFADLLDAAAEAAPEVRFRFTSPHPKDFPDELLHVIRDRPNVANAVHMPAQSGSSAVLESMRRGYTREAYIELVSHIRNLVPGVSLSSDFISGFCGETEEDHEATLSLIEMVQFDHAFMFAYSMRAKTHAYHKYEDDVPEDVKLRRLQEVIAAFHKGALVKNLADVGQRHLVLIEGPTRRSTPESPEFLGRTHTNKRCIVRDLPVPGSLHALDPHHHGSSGPSPVTVALGAGDFVAVDVESASTASLVGVPVARTTISEFHAVYGSGVASTEASISGSTWAQEMSLSARSSGTVSTSAAPGRAQTPLAAAPPTAVSPPPSQASSSET